MTIALLNGCCNCKQPIPPAPLPRSPALGWKNGTPGEGCDVVQVDGGQILSERNRLPWEGRSESSGFFCFFVGQGLSLPPSWPWRHPSIRTLEERLVRSVHVGRSRFSRCCHLIIALGFCSWRVNPGQAI